MRTPVLLVRPTRRQYLAQLSKIAACSLLPPPCKGTADPDADRWLETWMANSKASATANEGHRTPVGPLRVSRFKDPMYFLVEQIRWEPGRGQERFDAVQAPVGFVTDFASIPRVFWSVLRPDGDYAYAAVVHDYLYWTQTRTRKESDEIFRFAMQDFGINRAVIATLYEAVSEFGGGAWDQNRELRDRGEKRILKKLPTDPRVTWSEWKRRRDVFE